jgi:6-phosphogluconolactonase (cycloisomerase 2 family)
VIANDENGSLVAFPLSADGIPAADAQVMRHSGGGPDIDRQSGPHFHQVTFDAELLTVTDLGTGAVHRYVLHGATWVPAPEGTQFCVRAAARGIRSSTAPTATSPASWTAPSRRTACSIPVCG